MSYLVLARKWRPKTFAEVVGQQHVLRALVNGLDQNRLHHAFLFAGTRGVGKTTLARIFAKSLNCEQGVSSTPCGQCQSCLEIDSGRFVDLLEVDAASRTKVDDTRELLDNVQYAPNRGRYKVYLIDEVHMLSTSSFNALLKTLEEPPPHVKFLFATTDPQKLPVTILSRCLQFNLRRLEVDQIADHLASILQQENIAFEAEALLSLAQAADGSMRDALSLLDQAIAFAGGTVSSDIIHQMLGSISSEHLHHLLTALAQQDGQALLQQISELAALGRDFTTVLDMLLMALQRIATLQMIPDTASSDDGALAFQELAQQFSPETIQLLYQIALHGKRDLPYAASSRSGFEMTLLRMLSFQPMQTQLPDREVPLKKSQATESKVPAAAQADSRQRDSHDHHATSIQVEPARATNAPNSVAEEPAHAPPDSSNQTPDPATDLTPAPLSVSAENWTSLVGQLKLSAISRQLADNCALLSFDGQRIELSLAAELAHLATDKARQRLQLAVSKQLNQAVEIVFAEPANAPQTSTTLAIERAEHDSSRQQQAQDAIHNDPVVGMVKKVFNARIIDSTIKPLNH